MVNKVLLGDRALLGRGAIFAALGLYGLYLTGWIEWGGPVAYENTDVERGGQYLGYFLIALALWRIKLIFIGGQVLGRFFVFLLLFAVLALVMGGLDGPIRTFFG